MDPVCEVSMPYVPEELDHQGPQGEVEQRTRERDDIEVASSNFFYVTKIS